MRRLLIAALACLLLGGTAAALALASDGPRGAAKRETLRARGHDGAHGQMHRAVKHMILSSLAQRMGVEPKALRRAIRAAAREHIRAHLRGRARHTDLAALKADLARGLASRLTVSEARVLGAVRSELAARAEQAVALDMLTARGRDLALGCFDAPAGCDLATLRREVRFPHLRRTRR